MFNIDDFSGNELLQQALTEVMAMVAGCRDFLSGQPPTTYAHIRTYSEKADQTCASVTQKILELNLARHLQEQQRARLKKDLAEGAFEDYGRSTFYSQAAVAGDAAISDLTLTIDALKSSVSALDDLRWTIKAARTGATDMFEKAKS